jgi:alkylation response protein AidB-like acyl-CoA dehydrogenase
MSAVGGQDGSVASLRGARPQSPGKTLTREEAIERIAARAARLDRDPRFPRENFADLAAAGLLQAAAERPGDLASEIGLVRALAAVDGSTARILDGHLNGVERLARLGESPLRQIELQAIREGRLLLGVWGADPAPEEGSPARLLRQGTELVLRGFKTFCSGAGGVQRALVVAADERGRRRLLYLDTSDRVRVDRDWYRGSGLRSSESHRVEFHDASVLAVLGGADALAEEPWLSRDAVRTAATWAGLADCILTATAAAVDPERLDQVRLHAIGRMTVAQASIDRWLEHAQARLGELDSLGVRLTAGDDPADVAALCRIALSDSAREIASLAATVCGSRALVRGGALDRARRDLDLFLLQHRLEPKIVQLGSRTLAAGDGR